MGQSFGSVNISVTVFFTGKIVSSGVTSMVYDALGSIYAANINSNESITQPSSKFTISYGYDECGKTFFKGIDSDKPNELIDHLQKNLSQYPNTPKQSITRIELEIDGVKTTFNCLEQAREGIAKILPRTEYTSQKPREYSRTELMQYHATAAYSSLVTEAATRMYLKKLSAEEYLEPYSTTLKQSLQVGSQKTTKCLSIMSECKEITQQHLEDYIQKAKQTLEPVTKAATPALNFMYQHQFKIECGLLAVSVAAIANQIVNGECPAPRYTP